MRLEAGGKVLPSFQPWAASGVMNRLAKMLGSLLLAAVICVAGFIALVEWQSRCSKRDVVATVSELSPGTPFSAAMQRLGQPTQTITNNSQIASWLGSAAPHAEARLATNSMLHVFIHRGPPFRYILAYTDRESKHVVQADWCSM